MTILSALGFSWDSTIFSAPVPVVGRDQALFRIKKLFPEFVWDTTALENNPFTFVEVQTLLEGITVGGRKLSDEQQVLNQAESWRHLCQLVKTEHFQLNKNIFCELNSIVAREEALEWGCFRTAPVSIAGTTHRPPLADDLELLFEAGLKFLSTIPNVVERAMAFFLFAALQQFFYDGNKRTGRLMMNGELMRYGFNAISIPGTRQQDFNEKMLYFYDNKDATNMMQFLLSLYER